jgi:trimeric autotransporter adhesin
MGHNRLEHVAAPIVDGDAANKGYVDQMVGETSSQITQAFRKIDQNSEGIAVAMAMGGLSLPDNKAFSIATNVGFYDGKQAIAAEGAVRINRTFALTGGVGMGVGAGQVGGRVGVMAAW